MQIEKEFVVSAAPSEVWKLLWDIPTVASCIPGCDEVRETENDDRYEATITERVGPFRVQFALDIAVVAAEPEERIQVEATGKDRRMGSGISVALELGLAPVSPDNDEGAEPTLQGDRADDASGVERQDTSAVGHSAGTRVTVVSTTRVQGKLASLGHSMMKRKVEDNIEQFAARLREKLEQG